METSLKIKKIKKLLILILSMIITETSKSPTSKKKIINIKILGLKRIPKFKIKNSQGERKK
jgi:hypothetical protein